MLEVGRQVGNYQIEQLVGRGGQGFVYRAVHVQLGSVHALKVLLLERGPLRERLLDEGRIQARLRHPNLVPVTDVVDVDGALGLVAEFVAGVPLDAWIAAERPTLAERLDVFRGVCAAVGAAHTARVVHRDLKPGNVLVAMLDGRPVPRVTDFGVAKLLDPVAGQSVTLPGLPVGTPGYMAPEQLRDASSVDARADVFALGCLLYELACGVRPFPDADLATYAAALATGAFVPPDDLVADLPAAVGRTVAACLRVDPDARPADMAEVLALLDGAPPRDPTIPVRTPTRVDAVAPPASPTFVPLPALPDGTWATLPPSARPRRRNVRWIVLTAAIVATAALTATGVTALGRLMEDAPAAVVASPSPAAPVAAIVAPVVAPPGGAAEPGAPSPSAPSPSAPSTGAAAQSTPSTMAPPTYAGPTAPSSTSLATAEPALAEPSAPRPGRVVASGEGEIVWLEKGKRRVSPDEAPEGYYRVLASFPGEEALVSAGEVSVLAGRTTRLKCSAIQLRCIPEEGR